MWEAFHMEGHWSDRTPRSLMNAILGAVDLVNAIEPTSVCASKLPEELCNRPRP